MGYVREARVGYEYVSDNGVIYEIGENGADFNIIIDTYSDYDEDGDEECEYEALHAYGSHLVDYVFGEIEDPDTVEWIDNRIERYENHERVVRFYNGEFCECYIGLKEEKPSPWKRVSKEELFVKRNDNNTK